MKIIMKTLKQLTFEVEIPSEKSTVLDLKKAIETSHNFDALQLKLLFSGVVLEDSKTLEEYKIQDGMTVVMMNTKVKVKNSEPQPSNQPQNPSPNEAKKDEQKEEKKEEKKPEPKPQQQAQENKNQFASQIASLIDMGFEKSQAEAAIKAARGQIDIAVDFLYNGIPEGINDNDNDLFMGGQNEGQAEEEGEEMDPLKKTASFAKILCQNDPSKLTNLLQNIQQSDPDLFSLINEREEEFKNLLEQPITQEDIRAFRIFQQEIGMGGEGEGQHQHQHHGGQGGLRINLTPEDREVIVRREGLKEKYNNENARITAKKEKLFNTGDVNKMEINEDDKNIDKTRLAKEKPYAFEHICYADTRELEKLNNQLGYANKMNMRELRKLIKEYCQRFVENISTFDQGFYTSITDLLNTWTNMESFVRTVNSENSIN